MSAPAVEVPAEIRQIWWRIRLCVMYRRDRIRLAKVWRDRGRPAMAHDCLVRAREWNEKAREIARQLQG